MVSIFAIRAKLYGCLYGPNLCQVAARGLACISYFELASILSPHSPSCVFVEGGWQRLALPGTLPREQSFASVPLRRCPHQGAVNFPSLQTSSVTHGSFKASYLSSLSFVSFSSSLYHLVQPLSLLFTPSSSL